MIKSGVFRRVSAAAVTGSMVALLAAGGSSAATKTHTSSAYPIVIGNVYPYSGASGFIGLHVNAQDYGAVDEINHDGGILGHQIQVVPVDTKGDPADALPAAAQFVATHSHVFMVVGPGSDAGPELVPVFNRDHIVMYSAAGQSEFDHSNYPYFWRAVAPDAANGVAMAIYAKRQGWTKVATVFGSDQGSQGDLPGIIAGLKALKLKLVDQLNVSPDQPSYQSQVARVLAAKPQVIFTESDPTTAATFFGELTQQNSGVIHIIATQAGVINTYMTPLRAAVGSTLFSKEFLAVSNASAKTNPSQSEFIHWLLAEKAAGQSPNPAQYESSPNTAVGYSGVILAALAANEAHSVSGSVFNKDILSVANPGKGKKVVYTYEAGVKAIKQGKKIQYIGPAGPYKFNAHHNSYGGQVVDGVNTSGQFVVRSSVSSRDIQKY